MSTWVTCETVVLDPASSLAAADVVTSGIQTIQNAVVQPGGHAWLHGMTLIDGDDQKADLRIYFFREMISLGTGSAASSIADSDARYITSSLPIAAADYDDLTGVSIWAEPFVPRYLKAPAGSQHIPFGIITDGTPTYTAGKLIFEFYIERIPV